MAWSEKARCVLVANGGDDGQGKVRMVKATLLKSQSAAIYIAILAKATVTPGPDDDSGLMSWPPVSQPIRCASRRGVSWPRSEEHTSELQSLMRSSYAVFCLIKKHQHITNTQNIQLNTQ